MRSETAPATPVGGWDVDRATRSVGASLDGVEHVQAGGPAGGHRRREHRRRTRRAPSRAELRGRDRQACRCPCPSAPAPCAQPKPETDRGAQHRAEQSRSTPTPTAPSTAPAPGSCRLPAAARSHGSARTPTAPACWRCRTARSPTPWRAARRRGSGSGRSRWPSTLELVLRHQLGRSGSRRATCSIGLTGLVLETPGACRHDDVVVDVHRDVGVERLPARWRSRRSGPSCRRPRRPCNVWSPVSGKSSSTVSPTLQSFSRPSSACTATSCGTQLVEAPSVQVELDALLDAGRVDRRRRRRRPSTDTGVEVAQWRSPRRSRAGRRCACVTTGLRPPMPNCVSTIQSLFIALSTDVEIDALAEAANTVMNATRPTPIISAEAVAARATRVPHGVLPGERAGHAAQRGSGHRRPGRTAGRSPGRAWRRRGTRRAHRDRRRSTPPPDRPWP